ncbi:hypothetical protein [Erythrobacter litoralis]|uniref:SMODS and SLOG-associating 2TM effector domain-containing protein n=1 Tax=Erythrobacter litoralis (strain HTCC2594) TaxID=314225 RepID=Q2N7D4_ERYLH|nr:hypothetical protein [Erythrobacter litoralis]ABC64407.1 hypothetical protein ELI_11575 [Erythrobacter litoralis HTCC2594]
MIAYCDERFTHFRNLGRWYYRWSYVLSIIAVIASVSAGVLAIWDFASKEIIGTIALTPALMATIASQLKLVEKSNWFYMGARRFRAFARTMRVEAVGGVPINKVEEYARLLNDYEVGAQQQWTDQLNFQFDTAQDGGR